MQIPRRQGAGYGGGTMSEDRLLLVMMEGPPGAGKSTLAEGLTSALGARTFRFGEQQLFELLEFADVARAFRTKTFPDTSMMLDAYRAFIDRIRAVVDVVVFDWSCVGMIEDLPCAQPDRKSVTTHHPEMRADQEVLSGHAREVRALADDGVLLVLDVPIADAIGRAHAQRGEQWFDPWREVASFRGEGTFLDNAIRYWEAGDPRAEDCVRGHAFGGWDVIHLDATVGIDDLLAQAVTALTPYMAHRTS